MPPGPILGLLVLTTAGAAILEILSRRRRRASLRQLAVDWGMTYSAVDTLRLTPKVAAHFPIPGAAHVRISDMIYGGDPNDPNRYRYVFTAEFTTGVVRGKR